MCFDLFSLGVLSTPSVVACHRNGSCSSTTSYVGLSRLLACQDGNEAVMSEDGDASAFSYAHLRVIFIVMVDGSEKLKWND
jgi:hypothetical protein